MSPRSSSIARPLKRNRQDEAESPSCNKRTNVEHSKTTPSEWVPRLKPNSPRVSHEFAPQRLLLSEDETSNLKNGTRLASSNASYFVHEPLRLDKPSIRLVEMLPPSTDGYFRCSLRHTTLDEVAADGTGIDYTCLSYVWGPETPTRMILLNGRPFAVRKNLWGFLRANSRPARQWFVNGNGESQDLRVKSWFKSMWIDAICIDQKSVLERNHQVQQMGRIYSCAARVLSWMGDNEKFATLFLGMQTYCTSEASWYMYGYARDFGSSIYWKRAWVMQELLLAKTLFLQAHNTIVSLKVLEEAASHRNCLDPGVHGFLRYLLVGPTLRSSCTLIENVELFCDKQCAVISDKIYSLISVSRDGAKLAVDYRSGPGQLAQSVLQTITEDLCLKRIALVSEVLQLDRFLSSEEKVLPLISIDGYATLQCSQPCARCGKRFWAHDPKNYRMRRTVRYVCLCCQHFTRHKTMQAHSTASFGGLMLVRQATMEGPPWKWRLFWDDT